MATKPEIDFIEGPAPDTLVITDLVVGEGAEAVAGGRVEVHYVGVDFETGEQFDASWDRGESITFPLNGLIAGWQEGIPGMKVGRPSPARHPAGDGVRRGRGRAPAFGTHPRVRDRPAERGVATTA